MLPDDSNHLPPKPPMNIDGETKLLLVMTLILFVLLVVTYR